MMIFVSQNLFSTKQNFQFEPESCVFTWTDSLKHFETYVSDSDSKHHLLLRQSLDIITSVIAMIMR